MTVTTPQAAAPGASFAVLLRGALVPSVAVGVVATVVAAVLSGGDAALAAALGALVVTVFFGLGQLVMHLLGADTDPMRFVVSSAAVVLGQLLFLLVVILALHDADWLDGPAFGLSALAVALTWQALQIALFLRQRRPVFDAVGDSGEDGSRPR